MLADRCPDDKERGQMIARATSGVALGVAGKQIYTSLYDKDHFTAD